jgi:major facilitator family transporter hsrA
MNTTTPPSRWLPLLMAISIFMQMLDATILNTAFRYTFVAVGSIIFASSLPPFSPACITTTTRRCCLSSG